MKRLLLNIFLFAAMFVFTFPNPAKCSTISLGPFSFTESDNTATVQPFNIDLGSLDSFSFTISEMNYSRTIIVDVDDNLGPMHIDDFDMGIEVFVFGPPALALNQVIPFHNATFPGQDSLSDDDGDGLGFRDGGDDEIILNVFFNSMSGSETYSDTDELSDKLSVFTGPDFIDLEIGIGGSASLFYVPSRVFETYWQDSDYSGLLTVQYNYTPIPLPTTILLLGSGLIGIGGVRRKFKK
jgi:hypothetical protein